MNTAKLRTILVDDETRGINSLQKLLQMNCPEVEIIGSSNNPDEAVRLIETATPNLVFLDINMPEKNGFELLKEIADIDFEIIFVTAHNEYALQAFHFSAIDYLLKPVEVDLLIQAVKRAAKRIEGKVINENLETLMYNMKQNRLPQDMKICIHSLKGFQVINLKEIIYCEAASNYSIFHLTDQPSICASRPIHEYETLLEDAGFLRVHKSFLVNLNQIKEYHRGEGGTVILSNNIEVEISRRKKELFIAKMKEIYKY